jgi:hypothetical protein
LNDIFCTFLLQKTCCKCKVQLVELCHMHAKKMCKNLIDQIFKKIYNVIPLFTVFYKKCIILQKKTDN